MVTSPVVRVIRSGLEESVHAFDVAVADASGRVVAFAGDLGRMLFARSSMKPLQASVSLSLAPFDFTDREVAVMCASHNAEEIHVQAVLGVLARAGVSEGDLQTPPGLPLDPEARAVSPERLRINSDCSGKHAGMLAACRAQGWPLESYRRPDHPLQQAVMRGVLMATGLPSAEVGVDGCGVPVHALELGSMATIYARLAVPDRLGDLESFAGRAISAMRAEPYLVAGRNRVDTAVMQVADDIVVKGGAEGLVCAALLDRGEGIALKVRDGSRRAGPPALVSTLRLLDAIDDATVNLLAPFSWPPVLGGGEPVGELRAEMDLRRP
jgi:L-asparaginase II